jgi:nicotinic acid phosphoribosyltransferase
MPSPLSVSGRAKRITAREGDKLMEFGPRGRLSRVTAAVEKTCHETG